jgi:hypothetical protein
MRKELNVSCFCFVSAKVATAKALVLVYIGHLLKNVSWQMALLLPVSTWRKTREFLELPIEMCLVVIAAFVSNAGKRFATSVHQVQGPVIALVAQQYL